MLELRQVSHWFNDQSAEEKVLSDISLSLPSGKSIALMGTSGSGKSTLLQIAAGLEMPQQGQVTLCDQHLYELNDEALSRLRREKLGFVFQQYNLIPGLSVTDNILFQQRLAGMEIQPDWYQHLLTALELEDVTKRPPEKLSGGQQQRVAIARTLAHKPSIIFADEPTGNLNDSLSHKVMTLFVSLVAEAGCSLFLVTHSKAMAEYTDITLYLQEGRLSHD